MYSDADVVQVYGTVFLPAVYMTTATYKGPAAGPWPPADFRPTDRVVFSMSTRPDRLLPGLLEPTIQSLLDQDVKPDAVYLNIPPGKNKRTGEMYVIPEGLQNMKGLTILRPEDKGPVTKLYPALHAEKDPRTIVITVDDDKSYPPNLLRTLAWHLHESENTAVGCCGWSHWWWPNHWQHVIIPYFMRTRNGVYTDVLQGVCGNGYRRGFFNATDLSNPPQECYTVDDLWIAGYLGTHGVKRAILSTRLDPTPRDEVNDISKTWALSTSNSKGLHVYDDCMAAVEKRYGRWIRVRQYRNDY